MKRSLIFVAVGLVAHSSALAAPAAALAPIVAPFAMPSLSYPTFPSREVSIVASGALAGGERLNTVPIQQAIDQVGRAGGGRIRVPAGRWLTGPIELRSHVNLHLEAGAVLVFTEEKAEYFQTEATAASAFWSQHAIDTAEADTLRIPRPMISAFRCENIAITGSGTIDGQGGGWWPLHARWIERRRRDDPLAAAAEERAWRGLDRSTRPQRPQLIKPIQCRNVLLEGFTALNGPFWMINPVGCENLIIRGLTVRAAWRGKDADTPNTDGINPESCRNVLIEHCDIDTGDDSIAIKSGRDELGRSRGLPAENIIIRNVRARRVAIGSEMSGDVRNVLIRDSEFGGTGTFLHIKTRRGRGGMVENIWVDNIDVRPVTDSVIKVDMEYWTHVDPAPPEPLSERTPRFRNFVFRNVRAPQLSRNAHAIRLNGLPEMPIDGIRCENLEIAASRGVICHQARNVVLENVKLEGVTAPAITLAQCENVDIRNLSVPAGVAPVFLLQGGRTRAVRLDARWREGDTIKLDDDASRDVIDFRSASRFVPAAERALALAAPTLFP